MIATRILVQPTPTLRARLRDLGHLLLRLLVLLRLPLPAHSIRFLVLRARLSLIHRLLADDAMPMSALAADEYVSVFLRAEEAGPVAARVGTGTVFLIFLAAVFRCFVEPSEYVSACRLSEADS